MDQSQELLLGHSVFRTSKYGYHDYRRIALSISNKNVNLKRASVLQSPDTESDGGDRNAEERNEDQYPHHFVRTAAELVTCE